MGPHRNSWAIGMTGSLTLAAAFALLSGCTHAVPLKATVDSPASVVQVPRAVGIYYSPEFRAYEHVGSKWGDKWVFPLGQASVTLLDRVFPIIFESALSVPNLPPLEAGEPELAAVIEPEIEEFNFRLPFFKTGTFTAEITYRFTLYSLNGDPFASWTVRGEGAKPGKIGFEFARWPGEAADLAMQDAATKFITGFQKVPEVRVWLRNVGGDRASWIPGWLQAVFERR